MNSAHLTICCTRTHTATLVFVFRCAQFYTKTLSAVCAGEQGVNFTMKRIFLILFAFLLASDLTASEICEQSEYLECNAEFSTAGLLSGEIEVISYSFTFGEAKRTSNKIVFVKGGELKGMYAISNSIDAIDGLCVYFSVGAKANGDSICLLGGVLPTNVLIDGELYELFR